MPKTTKNFNEDSLRLNSQETIPTSNEIFAGVGRGFLQKGETGKYTYRK
jgi:hypothetical protein